MAGLLKEAWPGLLIGTMSEFFDNNIFLSHGRNMTSFVDNDRINFAYSGGRPGITKNFRAVSGGLPIFDRTDLPESFDLDSYSTDEMIIPDIDLDALPYNKVESLLSDARESLIDSITREGLHSIAPQQDSTLTPVVQVAATNAVAASDSYKVITKDDFKNLRIKLDGTYPGLKNKQWWIVLDPVAYWGLVASDDILKNQYALNLATGVAYSGKPILKYFNFNILCDARTANYDAAGVKKPFGSTFVQGTDLKSANVYVEDLSFCTALGTTKLYAEEDRSDLQGSSYSFRTRAYVGAWGQVGSANIKHVGAILRTV